MSLTGKGMMIWMLPRIEDGSPERIAIEAQKAGFTHVLIKVADGLWAYNVDRQNNRDYLPPVIQALRARGIQVWGWHYVYGQNVQGESRIAIQRVKQLQLDGYVINAEIEYKSPGMHSKAEQFMKLIRHPLASTPIALSSFRYPKIHHQFPWKQFLTYCDYNMPQVYWEQAHTPASQLERSYEQFRAIAPNSTYVPTGSLYKTNGWVPTPNDMLHFLKTATSLGLKAANFYVWDHRKFLQDQWNIISAYDWSQQRVEQNIGRQFIDTLNALDAKKAASLYADNAVHITSKKTIQGRNAIQSYYETFFKIEMPGARFNLLSVNGSNHTFSLYWRAHAGSKEITGRDAIGVYQNKITYHYSQIL